MLSVSEVSPGQSPGRRRDQRPLVFPQGQEEICKEEVVESEGTVAESRHIDLQRDQGTPCECDCQVAWTGGDAGDRERAWIGQFME